MTPLDPPAADVDIERMTFDSDAMPDDGGFERYRQLYSGGTEVVRTGPAMSAQVRGWRLDRMLLYDRRLHDVGHRRDARQVQTDGFDHFTVTLLLAGQMAVVNGDGAHTLLPGEVMLIDTAVPNENRMSHAHLVTMAIARERMAAITGDVDALHGTTLPADKARLFREFVESLLRNLPTMSGDATRAAAGVLTALLTIAIDETGLDRHGGDSRDLDRLAQLRRLVDAQITDPHFDATEVIRRSRLSRATLYRLLAPQGGVATFIRNRRLEHLRRRLSDRADTRSIAELIGDAGFASISHASRAFFARYGVRPSDYRGVINSHTGSDAFLAMQLWQDEVR